MYILKRGDHGQEVSRLQERLRDEGYSIAADGIFGLATEGACRLYQCSRGEVPTGHGTLSTLASLRMPVVEGIDVSHHNGDVRWTSQTNTPHFVFIKSTEGRNFKDRRFHETASLCASLGVPFGFYHFGRPDTDAGPEDAVKEAEFFADVIGAMNSTLRPVLDLEKGVRTDDQYNAEWALIFCTRIESLLGVEPIIYTAKWYDDSYLKNITPEIRAKLANLDLWVASYNEGSHPTRMPSTWKNWLIWQYTNEGSCEGIQGKVDRNYLAGGRFEDILWR